MRPTARGGADEAQPVEDCVGVVAVAGGGAVGLGEQADPLVPSSGSSPGPWASHGSASTVSAPPADRTEDTGQPIAVGRAELQRLVDAGAHLVEVLPEDEYDEEHLPGALHLPLNSLTRQNADDLLDRDRPVIVYCWDGL